MGNTAEATHSADRLFDEQEALASRVQRALCEILKSGPFRASRQSQQLLTYIVDQSLSGHIERLKERIIGAEVFGRAVDYDTNGDPIVRSRAVEVRKRLAQYYMGEGKTSSIRIEIVPGSYIANFLDLSSTEHAKELGPTEPASVPAQTHLASVVQTASEPARIEPAEDRPGAVVLLPHHLYFRWIAAVLLVALVGLVAYSFRPKNVVQVFWSPLLDSPKPVLIYTGANPVYMPSPQLIERFKATHHLDDLETGGHEFLVPITEGEKFGAGDLVGIKDEFVTIGDVSANVGVASLLTHFKHAFDLRSGQDVSFGDLRQSPAVLIGAFNNEWTLQMTGDLPFVFGSGLSIRDRNDNTHEWHPLYTSDNKVQVDYALVARLPRSKTGGALIAIGGITQSGTRAAAEVITSQQGIGDLIHSLPNTWTNKNLELVLQTKVVNDIPTTPIVVAARVW